ncbi:MAG: RQC domain-containing protein, partial [Phycisphaerae bacterium]
RRSKKSSPATKTRPASSTASGKDVDELAADLKAHKARPYHAGMTPDQRRQTQEAFKNEECNLIVATVAFGMGIDRSNLRFVLHTATPKSLEAYQQETGRAGRDGLEAECVLLYSGSDIMLWKSIVERSAAEAAAAGTEIDPAYVPTAMRHLDDMDRYCRSAVCRHQALVEYFGQAYIPPAATLEGGDAVGTEEEPTGSCHACDLCLGDIERVADGLVVAQKILSCVARVQQRFGAGHVISVLRGENTERVRSLGHDQLPTYGLLKEHDKAQLRNFIYQLIGQKVLVLEGQEYPILRLNPASWEVMKKQRDVRLIQTRKKKSEKRSRGETVSWEGVDRELFEALRGLRHQLATTRSVPPYVIFSDATLRELARLRPSTLENLRRVYGIGEAKLRDFGPQVLPLIAEHCRNHHVALDQMPPPTARITVEHSATRPAARPNAIKIQAFEMFSSGASLDDVATATRRARSTISEYLCEFIETQRPKSVGPWVSERIYQQVLQAAKNEGSARLRPIYLALNETVDYNTIRIVVAHAAAVG